MENKVLKEELFKNNSEHEIFKRQSRKSLEEVIYHVNFYNGRNFLVQLNLNSIMPFLNRNGLKDQNDYWEHVVSVLIMNELKDKYGIETEHNVDEEKRMLSRCTKEEYDKHKDSFVDRNDVIESIRNLHIEQPRLHIIFEYINNDYIWNEVFNFFDNDLPFITMVYTSGEMPPMIEENRYVLFDKEDEGIIHIPVLGKKYEKKI